ncbi:MAG: regulatory protein RecX [Lachnospiraceae bacterium]|jgi:regulatory protein|nr:regulatory protein RecX [Lachnospiraceae bacterium]
MTILDIQLVPRKKNKYKVHLQGGMDLVLYKREVKTYGLEVGEEISEGAYQRILEETLIPRAKRRAMHLLEKQDRTRKNLEDKLRESDYPQTAIDAAIAYVESFHYIDDERYARSYVHFHQEGKSKRRIQQDLMQKGIDRDVIALVLEEEYETSEEDMIRNLLRKKHYDPESADAKERSKMYRFLAGRGFSSGDISRVLRGYEDFS